MTSLLAGWRGLGRFWLSVLALIALAGSTLQLLGPPAHAPVAGLPHSLEMTVAKPREAAGATAKAPPAPQRPGRNGGRIEDPNPAMLQPAPGLAHAVLPRIAADGRMPMHSYAAQFDPTDLRPRVGVLIAGIGMSEADSMMAIKMLPPAISLAVSPYAANTDRILAAARLANHEYLLSIPMEPQGYPLSDPDDQRALMTSLPASENLPRLYWVMSRLAGYVGVTNALGQMHGERLSSQPDQIESVLDDVSHRGLLFIDARLGKARLPLAWNRSADILIDDDPADAASLDSRLASLSHMALDKGSALGLVSLPRPRTLERVAAWTTTLTAKGLTLAPVSALVKPPAQEDAEK